MHGVNFKTVFIVMGSFVTISVLALWSWNTLSELFNFPMAQYKHVLAAAMVVLLVKWGVSPVHHGFKHNKSCSSEHANH